MNSNFWNERYDTDELIYGEAPNDFLTLMRDRLPTTGRALDIGAGEGRNALFLATLGLDVLAVDQSEVGLSKAKRRAEEHGLVLRTQIADLNDFDVEPESLDVVSSIFVHLPSQLRTTVHQRIQRWLRPNGVFVLEAYAPDQIGRNTGGPTDPDRLASLETILSELKALTVEHAGTLVRSVVEGKFHGGEAAVVQVLARKLA